jgi:hypothetical protein
MKIFRLAILILSVSLIVFLVPYILFSLGTIYFLHERAEPGDLAFGIEIAVFAAVISIIVIFLAVKGIRYGIGKSSDKLICLKLQLVNLSQIFNQWEVCIFFAPSR